MGLLVCFGLRRRTVYDHPRLFDYLVASPLALIATLLYRLFLYLRGSPLHPPRGQIPVRIVCISDTHDRTVHVPAGDVLVHAGDLSTKGTASDIQAQLDWIRTLPHPIKIVVAGNHDRFFDPESRIPEDVNANCSLDLDGLTYLEDELSVQEINGRRLSFFGSPHVPYCGDKSFAFQYPFTTSPWFSRIPPQTDVLVTHTPPKHHRDLGLGCPGLLREIWRVRPRLHVFGHVHSAYGSEPVYFDEMQAAYERLLSRPSGPLSDLFPSRRWLDFLQIIFQGVRTILWKWLMAGPGSNRGGLLVNAAQAYETTNIVKSRAIVVDI
ncbi:metallophosphoesterase domain-containing protein [Ophiocordyceps camponoti-floridani]|uniref:Metallophosphoesterase domain-containing protein n=1 Tax=Ophiocordyceps camponoti-floridani TaxID=2030778 RepID=A0A8H4QB50_9HYPO|nr:metallophosphoesterase domain-containing protein [Ophiocordyceps camponoti-floridani]